MMLKSRSEIMDFLNDEDNWETIPFSEDIRMRKLNLGDRSVRLVELKFYDPHLKINIWHVSSIQLFNETTEIFSPEINPYELADYIERHKNDEIIRDFVAKGDE